MTPSAAPALTVVIPTYNRKERLHRVLSSLAGQTVRGAFDVVVVSDGSTDGTDDYLRSDDTPIRLTAVTQENGGPAAARNRGLVEATGELVLFIDDDVVPADDLVERHLQAHRANADDVVVIGPMLNPTDAELSSWVEWEQHQLYKQYEAMRRGDWECTFRQFYTGNASVPRQRVIDVGLFDPKFRRAEDVELAFRLHEAGVRFIFDRDARGYHYAERSFESWLKTPYEYGSNDVEFMRSGQRWIPDTLPTEFRARHRLVRGLTTFCVKHRGSARVISSVLQTIGKGPRLLGPVRRQALSALYNMTYYQGIADTLGSADAFMAMMSGRDERRPRVAFVLEQTLGHITHSDNLRSLLAGHPEIEPVFLDVPFDIEGVAARVPGLSNWTVRAGIRARRAIRTQWRVAEIEAMLIHTQVPAVLTGRWMRKIPTIVSLDATPEQYDQLGEFYAHDRSSPRVEALKKRANIRCFQRARALVTWSAWARESLVADYGVEAERVTVIPPGVDVERWTRPTSRLAVDAHPVRVLFVGGDLGRKGGHLLIEAARRFRDDSATSFEVHLVTRSPVESEPGIVVHSGMAPNSSELIALYQSSHIFCLPTLGDCLPMVLSEAGAAGMALISTDVGAIHEIVRNEETGLLVDPGDLDSLSDALARLINDPELRAKLGSAAQALVQRNYDAEANADRLVQLLLSIR